MKVQLTPEEAELVRELARELGYENLDVDQAVQWLEGNFPVVIARLREFLERPGLGWVLRSYLAG